MSITEQIKSRLRAEERTLTTIALPKGFESNGEPDVIPAGVDLRLFNSKNLDLTHMGGGGNLILYKCEIKNLVTKPGTHIHLYDCKIKNKLELYGTTGLIEGSTVEDTEEVGCTIELREPFIKIEDKSNIEFIKVNFRNMRKILEAKKSKIEFQECRNRQELHEGIYGETVKLKISRCMFFSTYKCIELYNNSRIDVMSSHLKGYQDMCLALSATKGKVTDCQVLTSPDGFIPNDPTHCKGLFGAGAVIRLSGGSHLKVKNTNLLGSERLHDYGVDCDVNSTAEFTSTSRKNVITGGGYAGIRCAGKGSSVSVINYETINSKSEPGIQVLDQAKVFVSNAKTIFSADVEAINVDSGASLELDNCKSIEGKTWGIICNDSAKLSVDGLTNLINGSGDDGIIAKKNCELTLTNIIAIIGQKSGINTSDNCQVSLFGVKSVLGSTIDGLTILDGGKLLAKFTGFKSNSTASDSSIIGQKSGIKLSSGVNGILIGYNQIEGQDEDGISLQSNCKLTAKNINAINGQNSGIYLSDSSRVNISDINSIEGETKYGIGANSKCSSSLENITDVIGLQGGISFTDNNDYLHFRDITNIKGNAGTGIYFDGKGISGRDVTLIETGAGNGIEIRGATGTISDIKKINGFESGLVVKNSSTNNLKSDISALRIDECIGQNSPHGLDVIISKLNGENINFVKDGLASNAQVELDACTFGGAFVSNKSSLHFKSCRVDGHFEITETSFNILNTRMFGEHISTDSSGTSQNYKQGGNYTATNEGAIHTNLTLGGTCTIENSTMEIDRGSVAGKVTASTSTFIASNVALDGGMDAPSSSLELHNCTTTGITLNESSMAMFAGSAASIEATDSGLHTRAGTSGSVALTNSSLVSNSGNLGTIEVSNSAIQLHGTNATVNGLHKAAIICAPGYVVQGGSGKRYVAFDDEVREWYKKSYKFRVNNDYQMNVGNEGGTIEISGKDGISIKSQEKIYNEAPIVMDNIDLDTARPREPEVIG